MVLTSGAARRSWPAVLIVTLKPAVSLLSLLSFGSPAERPDSRFPADSPRSGRLSPHFATAGALRRFCFCVIPLLISSFPGFLAPPFSPPLFCHGGGTSEVLFLCNSSANLFVSWVSGSSLLSPLILPRRGQHAQKPVGQLMFIF
jgi:hypothetical protein